MREQIEPKRVDRSHLLTTHTSEMLERLDRLEKGRERRILVGVYREQDKDAQRGIDYGAAKVKLSALTLEEEEVYLAVGIGREGEMLTCFKCGHRRESGDKTFVLGADTVCESCATGCDTESEEELIAAS